MARGLVFDIIDILKDTDEANKYTRKDLEQHIRTSGYESIDRHTLRSSIELLNEVGFDIAVENGKGNKYYLRERIFEEWEIKLLCDMVYQCDFLNEKDVEVLVNKLKGFIGKSGRRILDDTYVYDRKHYGSDINVKYTIDKVMKALVEEKQLRFKYCEYNDKLCRVPKEKDFVVNPYKLLLKNGHYYLMLNKEGYKDIAFYRLDRMDKVELLDKKRISLESIFGKYYESQINEMIKRRLYNYDGENIRLVLKVNSGAIGEIVDNFYDGSTVLQTDEKTMTVAVNSVRSEGLFYWLMQHLETVEVIKPEEVRKELVERVERAVGRYKK